MNALQRNDMAADAFLANDNLRILGFNSCQLGALALDVRPNRWRNRKSVDVPI